ncbi:Peptidase S8/S53 domain - like 10 [Theobroma cacao]|nr:Peptidase S8/S53 domain - like 10 [Theobroma cacao]
MLSFSHASSEGIVSIQLSEATLKEEINLKTYIVYVQKPKGKILNYQVNHGPSRTHCVFPSECGNWFCCETGRRGSKSHGKGVIKVHPQRVLPLHTTHSTDFLGLHQNMGFWKQSNFRKGVIIGVQDTGITPSHPSFSDEGVPPPEKWKGRCELVECNNKLIGARNFRNDEQGQAPLDQDGHSTHTASTTAGNFVQGASVFGKVNVTAVGMAP